MRLVNVVASLLLMLLLGSPCSAAVQLDSGAIEGGSDHGVLVFKGIPYAAPPVGSNRWRPPGPVPRWDGVRQADRFSPTCLQRGRYPKDSPPEQMSEDCLYLNVWVPEGAAPQARLPVMVWIHGGGLRSGSGSVPLYAGDELAKRGVIIVTLNYRLGVLGFLAHPDLSREQPGRTSGNYGLLDQISALQWVRRNIGAFGGDPDNVTVFGQSSGSISISVLCASPLASGLFRRAIGQSGGLFEPVDIAPEFSLQGAEAVGMALAERAGAKSINDLRGMPAERIAAMPFVPNPVVDGHVLREPPFDTYAAGRANKVDLLAGSNAGEGHEFFEGRQVTRSTLLDVLRQDFPSFIVSLLGPDVPSSDREAREAFVAFEGNMRFGWDMLTWARLNVTQQAGKSYLYHFEVTPEGEAGARHGVEMPYIFGHQTADHPWTASDRQLSATMISYWTNFARSGDPNGPGLVQWPQFDLARENALLIGSTLRAEILPNSSDLEAINRLYAAIRLVLKNLLLTVGLALLTFTLLLWLAWLGLRRVFRAR